MFSQAHSRLWFGAPISRPQLALAGAIHGILAPSHHHRRMWGRLAERISARVSHPSIRSDPLLRESWPPGQEPATRTNR
jgi:hypothetical protein